MAENGSLLFYLMYAHRPLRMFEEFSHFVEEQLSEEVEKKEEILNAILNSHDELSEEEIKEHLQNHEYEIFRYKEDFVNISRSSLVMSIYAFAEKQLITLCNKNSKGKEKQFKKDKDKKSVIENAQIYLEENAGVDFSEYKSQWELIEDIRSIRNCFAHNFGSVKNLTWTEGQVERLNAAIKSVDKVSVNSAGEIQLEKEVAIKLCAAVGIILREIYVNAYSDD